MKIDSSQPNPLPIETEPHSPASPPSPTKQPSTKEVQNQLLRSGFSLPRFGADGRLGRETESAIRRFQQSVSLPPTGQLTAQTLLALERAAASPPSPNYSALAADGMLRAVMAVGYDEIGAHVSEQEDVLRGLVARGYSQVTDEQRGKMGLDFEGSYFTRKVWLSGREVNVLIELITSDTHKAKERFAQAMRQSELVMYGGHGRYGAGPDFDDIGSAAGNFVIGQPYEAGHVTLGPNDLEAAPLTTAYQLMFFDGCSTFRYFDDLRSKTPGKTSQNLDVIGSNAQLFWSSTAANLLGMLDGVVEQKNLGQIEGALDEANGMAPGEHAFRGDGFEDNL